MASSEKTTCGTLAWWLPLARMYASVKMAWGPPKQYSERQMSVKTDRYTHRPPGIVNIS